MKSMQSRQNDKNIHGAAQLSLVPTLGRPRCSSGTAPALPCPACPTLRNITRTASIYFVANPSQAQGRKLTGAGIVSSLALSSTALAPVLDLGTEIREHGADGLAKRPAN